MPPYLKKQLLELWRSWRGVLIALISGLVMGLAVTPIDAWYLGWVGLAPLWVLVAKERRAGVARYGLAWGMGYHGVVVSWIFGIHPMTWMGVPWASSLAIATVILFLLALLGGLLVTLWASAFGLVQRYFHPHPIVRVWIGTALWCGLEYFCNRGDFWWSTLALTQSPGNLPILHLGQLSGSSAVVALMVAVNGAIGEAWLAYSQQKSPWPGIGAALAMFFVGHTIGYGLHQIPLAIAPADALKIGIIQGNIPNELKIHPAALRTAREGYTTGYRQLADRGVAAILTPEGALPYLPEEIKKISIYTAITEKKVPLWLGAFGRVPGGYTNSLQAIDSQGNLGDRYDKYKLVPFGEYIPFQEIIGPLIERISPWDSTFRRGAADQQFMALPGLRAIVGICYESAFGEVFRQQAATGEIILTASNNAHYAANMPAQHHALDVMRAIETSRWAVRATNTGYSAIVDAHGHTLWKSPLNQFAIHDHQIYRRRDRTLYVQWGDWLTPSLLLTAAGLMAFSAARRTPRT
jgi:apolipoprotein N-acyltransferase